MWPQLGQTKRRFMESGPNRREGSARRCLPEWMVPTVPPATTGSDALVSFTVII